MNFAPNTLKEKRKSHRVLVTVQTPSCSSFGVPSTEGRGEEDHGVEDGEEPEGGTEAAPGKGGAREGDRRRDLQADGGHRR